MNQYLIMLIVFFSIIFYVKNERQEMKKYKRTEDE